MLTFTLGSALDGFGGIAKPKDFLMLLVDGPSMSDVILFSTDYKFLDELSPSNLTFFFCESIDGFLSFLIRDIFLNLK